MTFILSAIGAAVAGGPALGGRGFTAAVQAGLALPDAGHVWQPLCIGALLASVLAAIATQMYRSRDASGRITVLEAANGTLEGILFDLKFTEFATEDALNRYRQVTDKIGFV